MQAGVVDIDGQLCPAHDAKISVFDRGFLYGDSAFEVMRTYGKRPHHGRAHLTRLLRSCELLRIRLSVPIEEIEARITRAIAESHLDECYLRIVVTRGTGPLGLDVNPQAKASVLVFAVPLSLPDAAVYRDGVSAGLVRVLRPSDGGPALGAKASNYLASLLALDDTRRRGLQEAILLGERGEVLEGATSNVFAVRDGALATPPLSAGILEGITRRAVIELASEIGITCQERELFPSDLESADEVFLTSSVRELVPVVVVEQKTIGSGRPGPVFAALTSAYRRATAASL